MNGKIWNGRAAPDETTCDTLACALEREHREIDAGIEAFLAPRSEGTRRLGALRRAIEALRRHIFLEEEFLFPPLRAAGLVTPVFVILRRRRRLAQPPGP
jgi:regulator of cell morphogenesis and NO signaling